MSLYQLDLETECSPDPGRQTGGRFEEASLDTIGDGDIYRIFIVCAQNSILVS